MKKLEIGLMAALLLFPAIDTAEAYTAAATLRELFNGESHPTLEILHGRGLSGAKAAVIAVLICFPFGLAVGEIIERRIAVVIGVIGGIEVAVGVNETEACLAEVDICEIDPETEIFEIRVFDGVSVGIRCKYIKTAVCG